MAKPHSYLFPTHFSSLSSPAHCHPLHVSQAVIHPNIQEKMQNAHFGEVVKGSLGESAIEFCIERFFLDFIRPAFDLVDALPKFFLFSLQSIELFLEG